MRSSDDKSFQHASEDLVIEIASIIFKLKYVWPRIAEKS